MKTTEIHIDRDKEYMGNHMQRTISRTHLSIATKPVTMDVLRAVRRKTFASNEDAIK